VSFPLNHDLVLGGPIINKFGVQVGVVSFGADCADPYYPGVYSRTSGAMDWLKNNICRMTDHPDPAFCGTNGSNNQTPPRRPSLTKFSVTVQYDSFPAQVGWIIRDTVTNAVVAEAPMGSVRQSNVKLTEGVNLIPGRTYLALMQDGQKNGFTAGKEGFMTITGKRLGMTIWQKPISGDFTAMKVVRFQVPGNL